jgi:Vitamin K-dependent gamma-carboxylase
VSENLFSRRFWSGDADARIYALYRIVLGVTLLYDALDRLRDFHSFYTELGVMPRAVAAAVRGPWSWSLFDMCGPWRLELSLYLAGVAAIAAFTLGYRTRLASFGAWLFLISIQHRNELVLDGSDVVLRVMLFWMLFADCGACWSLDVRWGRRSQRPAVPAHALGFLRIQLALVYLFTAVDKWHGGWWRGNYLYQVMQSLDFVRWAGPWLLDYPRFCRVATRGVLVAEILIPILWLSPFRVRACRALGILFNLALHAGIFSTLAVGNFPAAMIGGSTVFLLPSWLDRFSMRPRGAADPDARRWPGLAFGGALLAAVIASVAMFSFNLTGWSGFNQELELLGLQQYWPMFAGGLSHQGRWYGPGTLADGSEVDVFTQVAPGLLTRRAGGRYSRWYKLRFGLAVQRDYTLFDAVGRYLCRRYNGTTHGPLLRELQIQYWDELITTPESEPRPPARYDMYRTTCIEAAAPEGRLGPPRGPAVSPPQP